LLGLHIQGAKLIPDFKYFRAHHNKVFMEILRDILNIAEIKNIKSRGFGTYEEYRRSNLYNSNIAYVIKPGSGTRSRDVKLINNVKNKKRPITKNIKGILKDISDLKRKVTKNKFVIFIVFPVIVNNSYWAIHIHKIQKELSELTFKEFKFNNSIPGLIYYGKL